MEHAITIKLPTHVTNNPGNSENIENSLLAVLNENSEKIGYLIQDYYPREKVRGVHFDQEEIRKQNENFVAKATFTLEQFNVCAAIDTIDKASMLMNVCITAGWDEVTVSGEWVLE